jgi:hypothetical protein
VTHTRESDAEECLRRIAGRQLEHLGVTHSEAELTIHRRLGSQRVEGTRSFLRSAAAWLERLEAANAKSGVYASGHFRRVVAMEWLTACDAVARAGCWSAWPSILGSHLTARVSTDPVGRRQLARLPWRTARGYVRRRWPAAGPRARALFSRRASVR